VILQFAAKVIGGGIWSFIFKKYDVSTMRVWDPEGTWYPIKPRICQPKTPMWKQP
jgi:hypothetical protein